MYVCMCMCFLFVCAVMENPHVVTFFFMNLGFVYCSVYDLNTLLFRVQIVKLCVSCDAYPVYPRVMYIPYL